MSEHNRRQGGPSEQEDLDFARHLTQALKDDEQALSDDVKQRLYEARQRAVDLARQPAGKTKRWVLPFLGAGVTTAAAILVVVLMLPVASSIDPLPLGEDTELAAAQDLELLQELEFVAWMMAMEESDRLGNSG